MSSDAEEAREMEEEEREEEMEQGSSLLNMEPHLLDKVLGYLTVHQMAEVSATCSLLPAQRPGGGVSPDLLQHPQSYHGVL